MCIRPRCRQLGYPQRAELIGAMLRPDLPVLADRLLKDAVLERLCSKPDLE